MEELVIDIMRETLLTIIKVSLPVLLTGLSVGLVVSIFQTATSIQEQTLAFIPKIIATFMAIILFGGWMMNTLIGFTTRIISSFSNFIA
ncbi:flagellar biosynthetic protein FliQ [Sporanaerobium hydrogeniformans]|uniref:Flagellar biosynthetic protein FliQ n=1 Tax=Sporanaerobium hydrogeniformans TaxID=3072179 RepID=A0AC61DG63_9FIRM|nr:flagellar biosynthesis protein FliQ [Sporanaerobium hydrogeniformans]PHV71756.1 flagellar biosynthetic protein FliQ [Sporanaerobium hydrogeniformans]